MSHVPLSGLMNAFADAGLAIGRVYEPQERPVPSVLAVKAFRQG
ncbi:hypothetical protein [Nonomuraea sp. NPDC005650]